MLNSEAAKKIVPVKPQSGEAGLAKALRDINSQNPWETATDNAISANIYQV